MRWSLPVLIVVVAGCGGSSTPQSGDAVDPFVVQMAGAARQLEGLQQIGSAVQGAPSTRTAELFTDASAPNAYLDLQVLPALLERFVRSGRLRLSLRTVAGDGTLLGSDAARAAQLLQAAGLQGHFWSAYYATRQRPGCDEGEAALRGCLAGVRGIDPARVLADAGSVRVRGAVERANGRAADAKVPEGATVLIVDGAERPPVRIDLDALPSVATVVRKVDAALR